MNMISFVVDKLSLHYYQAELLLYSLEINSEYSKKDIIVQCTESVDQYFLDFLVSNDYTYNIIQPYLDGKYCNKLQQLVYFINKDIDGVILMDTDIFIVDTLLNIKGDRVLAKIVDAPNPTLNTLKNIYSAAHLEFPKIVPSDWIMENNNTFENNFNGGFYYIPKRFINTMNREWKRWAMWLYDKKELFDNPNQFIHVDQISFSLALQANNVAYSSLSSNYNFPIHTTNLSTHYNKNMGIKIIHYHREIDNYGLLNVDKVKDKDVIDTIDAINQKILYKRTLFLNQYKLERKIIPELSFSNSVIAFEKKLLELLKDTKLTLYIHAGTPKTATTSLQTILSKNDVALQKYSFLYPKNYIDGPVPKHQWLVSTLLEKKFDLLLDYFKEAIAQANNLSREKIILSTEGIYNHWSDYSAESRAILHVISKNIDTKLLIVFREKEQFLYSLYKQNLKNPKITNIPCYGNNLSFDEMKKNKWFIKHLDYDGFLYDCKYIFKEENILTFDYSKDIIKDIFKYLEIKNIQLNEKSDSLKNVSLSTHSTKLLSLANKYNIKQSNKEKIIRFLSFIERLF